MSIKDLQQPGLGMFQYLADLTLLYSSTPLYVRPRTNLQGQRGPLDSGVIPPILQDSDNVRSIRMKKDALMALRGRLRGQPNILLTTSDSMGRNQLLQNMAGQFHTPVDTTGRDPSDNDKGQPMSLSELFGGILHSDGVLDLRNGVAHSYYVEELQLPSVSGDGANMSADRSIENKRPRDKNSNHNLDASEGDKDADVEDEVDHDNLRVHHRQWFASGVDNVLVGTMSCADVSSTKGYNIHNQSDPSLSSNSSRMTSCLNVAVRLTRDSGPNNPPPTSIQIKKIQDGMAFGRNVDSKKRYSDAYEGEVIASDSYALQITLKSGNGLTLPSTVACGVIRCNSMHSKEEMIGSRYNSSIGGSLVQLQLTGSVQGDGSEDTSRVPAVTCNGATSADIIISITNRSKYFHVFYYPNPHSASSVYFSALDASLSQFELQSTLLQQQIVHTFIRSACSTTYNVGYAIHYIILSSSVLYFVISTGDLDEAVSDGAGRGAGTGTIDLKALETKLLDVCWGRVSSALLHGIEGLRSRHENQFSERMDRSRISLGSANSTQTCPSGSTGGRLRSFGAGCRKDITGNRNEDNDIVQGNSANNGAEIDPTVPVDTADIRAESEVEQVLDVKLISQMYMYGRYLLFSSATHTPLNLQGIWTDGPSSSWNGE